MNPHFTKDYDLILDTDNHEANNSAGKPWYGIIPHSGFAVTSITIEDRGQLTASTTPTAAQFVADIAEGVPFLCRVTQIKLSAGGCKMLKPN